MSLINLVKYFLNFSFFLFNKELILFLKLSYFSFILIIDKVLFLNELNNHLLEFYFHIFNFSLNTLILILKYFNKVLYFIRFIPKNFIALNYFSRLHPNLFYIHFFPYFKILLWIYSLHFKSDL